MKPQTLAVLDYLKKHKTITPMEALNSIGTMRLGARIWELRESGVRIVTETEKVKTRYRVAYVARYRLRSENDRARVVQDSRRNGR